tara:strand:- start:1728 stop:2492 length:765 start_codon:yes stop_codon:yes gene_type:complete
MQFRDIPKGLSLPFCLLYRLIVPRAVKTADAVITVSEYSKSRILKYCNVQPGSIRVTYLAGLSSVHHLSEQPEESEQALLNNITEDPRPYLISVSSEALHKNIDRLVSAFLKCNSDEKYRLVLVGVKRRGNPDCVISTGFVSDPTRNALYQSARGYVFASHYEGFGLPLLESMKLGIPVTSSNAGSLPEIGGSACLYFNPNSEMEMIECMNELLENGDLRDSLKAKGTKRAAEFSWAQTAEQTEEIFSSLMNQT